MGKQTLIDEISNQREQVERLQAQNRELLQRLQEEQRLAEQQRLAELCNRAAPAVLPMPATLDQDEDDDAFCLYTSGRSFTAETLTVGSS